MTLTVLPEKTENKNWFLFRKFIFQGMLPIILKAITFYDMWRQPTGPIYVQLYFYTSLIVFLYYCLSVTLDIIFDMFSEQIVFQKEIDLSRTTPEISFAIGNINSNNIIITKRTFKIRYSKFTIFKFIVNLCWVFGVDCPMLIPIKEIQLEDNYYSDDIQQSQLLDRSTVTYLRMQDQYI